MTINALVDETLRSFTNGVEDLSCTIQTRLELWRKLRKEVDARIEELEVQLDSGACEKGGRI